MKIRFAVILAVLAVSLLATTAVCASPTWGDVTLTLFGSTETVKLTPTFEQSGSNWIYTYVLDNTSANVALAGFTLTLPSAVLPSSCTSLALPTGWVLTKRDSFRQLDWQNFFGDDIAPGQLGTFKFSTAFGPSFDKPASVSTNNALGFSGMSFSPVPEPGSLVALMTGLVGLVGLKRRRK